MGIRSFSQFGFSVLLAALGTSHAQPLSNVPRQDFWVTDGAVNAIAVTNDRVFIGGDFRYVGPYTGGGVPVEVNTMQPVAKYPKVNGSVHAVEPDGQGGWFIGGEFTTVGGRPRTNLAHVTAEGEVNTNWTAHATGGEERGRVTKLALDGDTLYAAGRFTHLGGEPRTYIGALQSASGAVKSWAPLMSSNVLALAVSPKAVYLGGKFRYVGESNRNYLAAIDKITGQATSWDPNADVGPRGFVTNGFMTAIAAHHDLVVVAGPFNGAFATLRLMAFNDTTADSTWAIGKCDPIYDLRIYEQKLFAVGAFGEIGGDGVGGHVVRDRVAALDVLSGEVLPWYPKIGGTFWVNTITFVGNTAYVGGAFNSANPSASEGLITNAHHIAAFDLATGEEAGPRRPFNNGWINTLSAQEDRVFFGGVFDSLAGVSQQHLAELDRRDGSLKSWNSGINGAVTAMLLHDETLVLGGQFSTVANQPRGRLAALLLSGMQLHPWNPQVDASNFTGLGIKELVPANDLFLIAGEFSAVSGQSRRNVALVSQANGQVHSWQADTDAPVEAAVIADGKVYLGGRFTTVGGLPRRHLGAVDLQTATVSGWNPAPDNWVTSLSANANAVYSAGYFRNVSGSARIGYAAHELTTGTLLPWSMQALLPSINDSHLLATDLAVYATGFFRHLDPVWGPNLLAASPDTGAPTNWDTRPYSYLNPVRLHRAGSTLFVVGDHFAGAGPKRMGLAVYEPAGFSRFTQADFAAPTVALRLSADQGKEFIIERTSNFDSWGGISTNIAWEGMIKVTDPTPPGSLPAFYRAKTTQQ